VSGFDADLTLSGSCLRVSLLAGSPVPGIRRRDIFASEINHSQPMERAWPIQPFQTSKKISLTSGGFHDIRSN
jgi:hypothetical protein